MSCPSRPPGCGSPAGSGRTSTRRPQLLARLGDPALWAAPLHWSALQAAIIAESREAAQRHAVALEAAAAGGRYAAAMASAAPHWVRLLDTEVDPAAVEAAARGLHAVGHVLGGRQAGRAGGHPHPGPEGDERACSAAPGRCGPPGRRPDRSSRVETDTGPSGLPSVPAPAAESDELGADGGDGGDGDGPLSGREREVAALVLEGLTYKQIGERLFISAKTVEHHVARMRQRLGSGSRGELFAHLRQLVP